jgi:hypothetical protein
LSGVARGAAALYPGGGGSDDRSFSAFAAFASATTLCFSSPVEIIADACHEADLVVDENESGIF